MVKYIKPTISKHMRYYSNPLKPIAPIWRIQLMGYGFSRVSSRGRYHPYMMKLHNLGSLRYKRNPITWILESKNDRRVFGKFNR